MSNKYADLNNPGQKKSQSANHAPTAVSQPTEEVARQVPAANIIASKEHTVPVVAFMDYKTDAESDALVRIYDGVIAKRDDAFLVERKELAGKTPEAIRDHFCLSFLPRFLCDASIPVGHRIAVGKVTNALGKRVSIFKALTALSLSSERPLTAESIPPVKLKPYTAPTVKPSVPQQLPLSTTSETSEMFSAAQANDYLRAFLSLDKPALSVPEKFKIVGPDGFPYISCNLQEGNAAQTLGQSIPPAQDGGPALHKNLVQSLLNEGLGLVLWRPNQKNPVWIYKYCDLLSFRIFGSIRPPAEYDASLYPETLDKPIPPGSPIVSGSPSEEIFPAFARKVLSNRMNAIVGNNMSFNPQIMQYPDIDTLRRFKLNLSTQGLSDEVRKKLGRETFWCLPYVTYF